MAAPRPKKKATVKKKPKIVFRNIAPEPKKKIVFKTTKDDSPKKSQAAKDIGKSGMRQSILDSLKQGPSQPQGPEAPTYREKIGPKKPEAPRYPEKIGPKKPDPKRPLLRLKGGTLYVRKDAASVIMKKAASKIPVVGAAVGFITDAAPAGEGSTKDKYTTLKKKYSSGIGPTKPKASTGSRKPAPGANYSGQEKKKIPMKPAPGANYSGQDKALAGSPFSKGKGNAALPKVKNSSSNTAATYAAASSSGGTSQAAKSRVGKQTRYQRDETAMEQKRSSSRPKKSIFSLFRKG